MKTLLLNDRAELREVFYYPVEETWQDRVREWARELVVRLDGPIEWLAKWDWCDELRWDLQAWVWGLWSEWREGSNEQILSVVYGEMPLHCVSDWERSRIVNFGETLWSCYDCRASWPAAQCERGKCPCCGDTLFLKHS
jgi:hypothetical protein